MEQKIEVLKNAKVEAEVTADLAALGLAMAKAAHVEIERSANGPNIEVNVRRVTFTFTRVDEAELFISAAKKVAGAK